MKNGDYQDLILKNIEKIPVEDLRLIKDKLLLSTSTEKLNTFKPQVFQLLPHLLEPRNINTKDSVDTLFALYSGTYYAISQDAKKKRESSPEQNPINIRNEIVKEIRENITTFLERSLGQDTEASVGSNITEATGRGVARADAAEKVLEEEGPRSVIKSELDVLQSHQSPSKTPSTNASQTKTIVSKDTQNTIT